MSRCYRKEAPAGPSLFQNGNLVFQAHHVGWIVASMFTIVATVTSLWLVNKHLQWYTLKREQRYIVRILFMVPIYAIISTASYFFWNHSTPLLLIRDGYESTVLTSFFYLLLMYLSPDPDEQRLIFIKAGLSRVKDEVNRRKGEKPQKWVFPLNFVKWKPADGLYFLQLMKWGVLQYCVIRPTTTLAAVILDYVGLYCEDSWGLGWGHIYITVIVSVSVSIAMYCLIQLYVTVSEQLKPRRPLLKLFAVKAVVFLTFWQATALSLLTMIGLVKDTKYMTADDINIGIGALLETLEMMFFGFLHIKAFSYKPYRPFYDPRSKHPPPKRTPRFKSLGNAMDFRETIRELWIGCVYLFDKMRGTSPKVDKGASRASQFEAAFGQARPSALDHVTLEEEQQQPPLKYSRLRQEEKDEPTRWLGNGADYGYGIQREKSESLELQIEKELERRGYGSRIPGRGHIAPIPESSAKHKPQRSWWRSIYERLSQSGPDAEEAEYRLSKNKTTPRSPQTIHEIDGTERGLLHEHQFDLDDPPPKSLMTDAKLRDNKSSTRRIREHGDAHRRPREGERHSSERQAHRHSNGHRERARRHRHSKHQSRPLEGRHANLPSSAVPHRKSSHHRDSAFHDPEIPPSSIPNSYLQYSPPAHIHPEGDVPPSPLQGEMLTPPKPLRRVPRQVQLRESPQHGYPHNDWEYSNAQPAHSSHPPLDIPGPSQTFYY